MSGRRFSRIRSEGLRVKDVAKPLVAVTLLVSCLLAISFTATAHRSVQPASTSPAQRRLVTFASGEQSPVQTVLRPAAPRSRLQISSAQQAVHLATGAFQADQPSVQLSDSIAQDRWAASVSAAAPGDQAELVPALSATLPFADASSAPSASSEPSRSTAPAGQPAGTSVGSAADAAASAQDSALDAEPVPVILVPRGVDSMPKRRSRARIRAAVAAAAAAAPNVISGPNRRLVTPEGRLRAFEWLFGPKEARPQPALSPVAAAAVAHDPACAAFYRRHPEGPKTVAVVGNGPLSDADRDHINSPAMDVVMRFNRLNNW